MSLERKEEIQGGDINMCCQHLDGTNALSLDEIAQGASLDSGEFLWDTPTFRGERVAENAVKTKETQPVRSEENADDKQVNASRRKE